MIFSIAMGADYTFYVKTIETHTNAFLTLNILAIGRVYNMAGYYFLLINVSAQMYLQPHGNGDKN